jgi:phosphoribosyl 1,2-cyclic phosphate phosphodiesterase
MKIQPIRLVHIPKAGVLSTGFVVNRKFGYLTDFKEINVQDEKFLHGLEVLYLGSPIDKPHMSHINHAEALALIEKYQPANGYVGHLSHQYLHAELLAKWQGVAEPAYDGQQFII